MGMGVEKWEMRSGNIQFVILSGVEGGNGQKIPLICKHQLVN